MFPQRLKVRSQISSSFYNKDDIRYYAAISLGRCVHRCNSALICRRQASGFNTARNNLCTFHRISALWTPYRWMESTEEKGWLPIYFIYSAQRRRQRKLQIVTITSLRGQKQPKKVDTGRVWCIDYPNPGDFSILLISFKHVGKGE